MSEQMKLTFDAVDVMEFVADSTGGPEPSAETVNAWLLKNYDGLDQALSAAFRSYVQEHWS